MTHIEPFFNWRHLYTAETDERSPFYERQYSELYFTNAIYDHLIHPQWDDFGSSTLYAKILFADYDEGFVVIELIGEWNDCIENDIMLLKRNVIDFLLREDINKFILVGENALNFHFDADDYYEEWFHDLDEGWIAGVNFREHVLDEFRQSDIDRYINFGGRLDDLPWRTLSPQQLFKVVDTILRHRLAV